MTCLLKERMKLLSTRLRVCLCIVINCKLVVYEILHLPTEDFFFSGSVQLVQVYDWHIGPYISIPIIFVTTIGMSLLSYYYFEKPANCFVKRILNKKQ